MIIDIHAHAGFHKFYPEYFLNGIINKYRTMSTGESNINLQKTVRKIVLNSLNDHDCSKLIAQMDEAGIDKTVLLIIDFGTNYGETELSIERIYESYHNIVLQYPERFLVFSGIDPNRGENGIKLFEKSIIEYGFSGLKLYPPCGFELNDVRLYPYYEICNKYGLPVLTHSGPSLNVMYKEKNYPESIITVSKDFPKLNFILGHAGIKNYSVGVELARQNKNIYLDISSFQTEITDMVRLRQKIKRIMDEIPYQVLFGTDWPMFKLLGRQKRWIDMITDMEFLGDKGLDLLLYDNASLLLSKGALK